MQSDLLRNVCDIVGLQQ